MVMHQVNFLPWRERRQQRCLRFWTWVFSGTFFVITLAWLLTRMTLENTHHIAELYSTSNRELQQALAQRETPLRQTLQQAEARLQWQARRAMTQAWQPRLQVIATRFPEQAWLTELLWQNNALTLNGYASAFPALAALNEALRELPDLKPAKAGKTERDAQGRWQFTLRLESVNAATP
ncbi:PilN family type IV pilus biogenesis protein [Trabulsiella guamensis ATCC 49490]|uniref:PilN family type IV pilus biogenesis protein n=1 Tax=Trabulsiella guamensis ATCC 49490 TaxID=1005994 RepID=A0A085A3D5_9ENTR|nr:PilN domain-containing protein [Trabulsiella guamensis]KFC04730.1 PilN family type IV pilus biogenesis protein [Trabulsiella guamensis ATCC 49490]